MDGISDIIDLELKDDGEAVELVPYFTQISGDCQAIITLQRMGTDGEWQELDDFESSIVSISDNKVIVETNLRELDREQWQIRLIVAN